MGDGHPVKLGAPPLSAGVLPVEMVVGLGSVLTTPAGSGSTRPIVHLSRGAVNLLLLEQPPAAHVVGVVLEVLAFPSVPSLERLPSARRPTEQLMRPHGFERLPTVTAGNSHNAL